MKVVLSGGGTAGHINPALALADVLCDRGHEVVFAGTPTGVEARLVAQAGITFVPFEAAGFDRQAPWTLVTSTLKILGSARKAKRWMKEISPDVVVGFGGYVCIPVGLAAESLGVPVVVHEQNSVMGMANKFLAKRAASATRAEGRLMLGVPEDATMLVVFGGSLGARHINQAVCNLKSRLLAVDDLYIVHITGPKEYDFVVECLALSEEESRRWTVMAYQDRMPETLAAADCAISRAGATSLAEISALGLPALLVPFPYATEDHQTTNAEAYVASGAAFMLPDDALDSEEFSEKLFALIEDESVRAAMRKAAGGFETQDAAAKLAEVVCRCARA